ncbi:MAG: hypothetical protein R3E12_14630 [Candidatus Eisenbacteria bacterium]
MSRGPRCGGDWSSWAVAPLIKDTCVIFWIIALATQALLAIGDRRGKRSGGSMLRRFGALVGAAAASAIITVVVLGWALREVYPEAPFLLRGFRQAVFLLFDAGVKTIEQPAWVYLRNLPAFGLLALALLPFGLMRSWKESRTQRGLVLAWVLAIAAVHLLSLRQVRYLLFVAPVTMFLIVPAARMVWSRRWMAWAAAGIWSIGFLPIQPYAIANAMTKIATPFYRHSEAKEFLEPLHEGDHYRAPIWVNWGLLSFCPPGDTPLAGDVYADLFHLGPHHLADLFPYRPNDVVYLDPQTLPSLPSWPEEAVFIATTRAPQFNPVTWHRGPAGDKFDQEQMVFLARSIVVQPAAGDSTNPSRWATGDGQPVRIDSATTAGGEAFSVLSSPAFPEDLSPLMPMRALFASSNGIYPVGELGAGKWAIPGTLPAEPRPSSTERVTFRFFERVRHLQYGQTDQD